MTQKLHNLKTPKHLLIASALFVGASISSYAQTWTGATSTDFLEATNWDGGEIPNDTDVIIAPSSNNPIMNASLSSVGNANDYVSHLVINPEGDITIAAPILIGAGGGNYFGSGTLNVEEGADINIRNQGRFGSDAENPQTVNVNGGLVNTKNQLIIGDNGDCTFNITGGEVTSTANGIILGGYNGVGIVNITGGVMRLDGGLAIDDRDDRPGSGYMAISGDGALLLVGDQVEAVQPYIAAEKIRTSTGELQAVYDERVQMTVVSVDPNSLSINDESLLKDVKISPNPTSGEFTVSLPVALKNITTEIYSINGAFVSTQKHIDNQTQLNINISNIASGIYVLKVLSDKDPISFKLVKQ